MPNSIIDSVSWILFSKLGITVGAVNEKRLEYANLKRNPRVLYVTAASAYDSKYSNETIQFLSDNFLKRENSDKDMWLFGIAVKEGVTHGM